MSAQELKNLFRTILIAQRSILQEYSVLDKIVDFITQAAASGIVDWQSSLTFNSDGTGAGAFSTYNDTDNHIRFWQSKTNGNINHQPPTNPLVTEDTYWKEVSPSDGSAIQEWAPGIYGAGLVIVYYDLSGTGANPSLYVLLNATRPFTSTDLATEITGGDWKNITGASNQLTITAEKSSNYGVQAFEYVPVDLTGGSLAFTIPTAPPDGTTVAVQIVKLSGSNNLTVSAGGSDRFSTTAGSTGVVLSLLGQCQVYKYKASNAVWYIQNNDGGPAGRVLNALTVDNSSLQLSSGINYDGSASETISVKTAGITNSMLFGGIDLTSKVTGLLPDANISSAATWNATLGAAQAYTDAALVGAFSYRGSWNGAGANYPTTGGRGASGVPAAGDAWEISTPVTIQGIDYDQGDIIVAKVATPGQTTSNWGTSEHNTQQATTSVRGTAMIVDTTTIQNNATTDDAKMVTAKKFWQGISTLKAQVNTWTLAQTFSSAPVFSSVTANQYLKVDGSKNLTSVASIPFSDLSGASAAWLTASGGTATAANTFTFNSPNFLNWGGTLTATANNQYYSGANVTATTRSTASDSFSMFYETATINLNANLIDAVGRTIEFNPVGTAGVATGTASTFNNISAGLPTAMTPGTYTTISPSSTSGTATGVVFTVIVNTTSTFTSFNVTSSGSGAKIGDTFTFNGSLFGGSGSAQIIVKTLTTNNSGANATVLRLIHDTPVSGNNNRYIDFVDNTGTSIGGIATTLLGSGGTRTTLDFYSRGSLVARFDPGASAASITGALSVGSLSAGGVSITGASAFCTAATTSNTVTNFTNSAYQHQAVSVGGVVANYNLFSFSSLHTAITGALNTATTSGAATNGSYPGISLTGGSGTGGIGTIVVSGGVATSVTFTTRGSNYTVGDVLSGVVTGGTASITVTSTDAAAVYVGAVAWAPTQTSKSSGYNFIGLYGKPTFNLTNGYTGISAIVYYDPVITSHTGKNFGVVIVHSAVLNAFGLSNPTATVEIGAQTSTRAALKMNSGTVLSSTVGGVIEYNNLFYITKNSGLRVGLGGSLFETYADAGNTSTAETDIFTYTTPANTLEANGGRVESTYSFSLVNSASTKQIKVYFAGTVIFDSGALTVSAAANLTVYVTIIRVSSSVVRYIINGSAKNTSTTAFSETGELTGVTLSGTNILKSTGTAAGGAAATNDIVGKTSVGYWMPVSQN